jgi:hypothetical protein
MHDSEFHQVADEFIKLANELSETWGMPFLTAAFMYAAARYNSFNFYASQAERSTQSSMIDHYSDEFRKMLQKCMTDYKRTH